MSLDAFAIGATLVAALEAAGIPYAVGGALAYGAWGDPRYTHDVDLNVFVGPEGLDGALDVLVATGLAIDREEARRADREGATLVGWFEGMRVDIFTPSIPFSWEAAKTRRRLVGPVGAAWYLSAEATAIFKLLFFRPKDLLDVEKLVLVMGADLDRAYIRRWLVEMMGEGDERVEAWDKVVRAAS